MRITSVKVMQLEVPLKKTYALSKAYGKLEITEPIVIEVHTDEGIIGYGECEPWPLFTGESVGTTITVLKEIVPAIIGADPCNIWDIHHRMDRVIKGKLQAKGAIDIACYDILGKAKNMPVHQILGGKQREKMPVMWAIGGSTPEESAAEVLAARDAGYQGCMIKVGGNDYKLDAARTIAVREAVGPDFALNVDANQGWDTDTAIRFGKLVEKCDLMYFEQPVKAGDVYGMAKVRRALNIPISADEGVITIEDALHLIKNEAADIFSIKVSKNGGIMRAKEIINLAKAHGIQIFFNSQIEEGIAQAASLQMGATTSNIVAMGHAYFSPKRLEADICTYEDQINVEEGTVSILDKPGLGIELKEDRINKYLKARYIIE